MLSSLRRFVASSLPLRAFVASCLRAFSIAFFLATACQTPPPRNTPDPLGQSDRLAALYPELRAGRFAVIADFEDPAHTQLVHEIGGWSATRVPSGGRPQSGPACLLLTPDNLAGGVAFSSESAADWFLKRDWRPYDLLLLSVYWDSKSPDAQPILANIEVTGGHAPPKSSTAQQRLAPGWNLLRVDLAELRDQLPIDDIRAITFTADGLSGSQLRLDDLLITGDRQQILASDDAPPGTLCAKRIAQRYHIAASNRFELIFAHGQLVAWFDLVSDPARSRNLAADSVIGTLPPTGTAENGLVADSARMTLLEANAVRTVLECELRLRPAGTAAQPPCVASTRYSIYPTGRVYFESTCAANAAHCAPERPLPIGIPNHADAQLISKHALVLRPAGSSAAMTVVADAKSPPDRKSHPTASLSTYADRSSVDRDSRAANRDFATFQASQPTNAWVGQLTFESSISDAQAQRIAEQFLRPLALSFESGDAAADAELINGFDRSTGAYILQMPRGGIRFSLPIELAAGDVTILVRGPGAAQAWVYIDHLIHKDAVALSNDELLFCIPRSDRPKRLIEILAPR